mmetsp:Transcript_65281/g.210448  ORF Transcript_65281/g.210448 Transcript_65281/m.210448 type:complete len:237 (+) Transcript_65281:843-1553(+)
MVCFRSSSQPRSRCSSSSRCWFSALTAASSAADGAVSPSACACMALKASACERRRCNSELASSKRSLMTSRSDLSSRTSLSLRTRSSSRSRCNSSSSSYSCETVCRSSRWCSVPSSRSCCRASSCRRPSSSASFCFDCARRCWTSRLSVPGGVAAAGPGAKPFSTARCISLQRERSSSRLWVTSMMRCCIATTSWPATSAAESQLGKSCGLKVMSTSGTSALACCNWACRPATRSS